MPKGAKTTFTGPVGRLLQGDLFTMNTKDKTGAPRVVKSGPNIGQPSPQLVVVVGYPKNDPEWLAHKAQIKQKAAEDFPQFFPQGANGPCTHPNFAWKWQDGDGFDGDGKPNNVKEGWAGHDVVKYTSGYQAKVYNKDHYAPSEEVFHVAGTPSPCPRGFFIRVNGTIEGNDDMTRPGMFLNVSLLEINRPGPEIRTGPSAEAAFGGGGGTTIDHSATVGLVMTGAYTYETLKTAGWTDEAMIAAGHATRPVAVPPPPAAPAPTPPAPAAPLPPAAPQRVMLPAAQGQTYEALIAAGWTDALLVQHGMMAAPVVAAPVPPSAATLPPVPGASSPPAGSPGAAPATPSPSSPPPPPYSGFREVPAGRVMLPGAQGQTYEAMIAAGWTDAQLIQHGMMAA